MKSKMKKNLILKSLTAIFISSVLLTSCLGDPEPVVLDAAADVFIQKIVENDSELYGLGFVVYGNKGLESVTVKNPDDKSWTLKKESSAEHIFYLFPGEEDYSETMPETGDYEFTVKSTQEDEAALVIKDKLETKTLDALVIDSVKIENSRLELYWQSVKDADEYVVRLYDSSENLIYLSPELDKNAKDYKFGTSDQGWLSSERFKDDETYRAEVRAVLYQDGANIYNKAYSVQFISIGKEEIVWND